MRRVFAILALVLGAAAFSLLPIGCAKKLTGSTVSTDPPHTTIFVSGTLDTVNHLVHLYWYGTSAHGYIKGYEVRMIYPDSTLDPAWTYTLATDSAIAVYTPKGRVSPYFEARAIDDHDVRDPHPARQKFNFSNKPPIISLVGKPNHADKSDTTFASVTVTWAVTDSDGNASSARIHIWLDGQQNDVIDTSGTSFTVPSSRFKVNGAWPADSMMRTLYIQAIDDGGMAGNVDQVTWKVAVPRGTRDAQGRGRVLVIDDMPPGNGRVRSDTLYSKALERVGMAPGTYSVLYLQNNQPFRSAADIAQTFGQFRNVIWYRGVVAAGQSNYSGVLNDWEDGVGAYVKSGGHFYLETQNVVTSWASTGTFSETFVRKYLAPQGMLLGTIQGVPNDSSATWTVPGVGTTTLRSPWLASGTNPVVDSVLVNNQTGALGAFRLPVSQLDRVVLLAPPGGAAPSVAFSLPLAVAVPQDNNGLLLVNTLPVLKMSVSSATPQRTSAWLREVMEKFLVP